MKTATAGHGTIAVRMRNAGLSYEITDVQQIATFLLTGGPYAVVAQYEHRVFAGFYNTRRCARTARGKARRVQGVTSTRVIQILTNEEDDES